MTVKKDETTLFSYFIGCEVGKNSETPKEVEELIIPAQKCTKFTAKGTMTDYVTNT